MEVENPCLRQNLVSIHDSFMIIFLGFTQLKMAESISFMESCLELHDFLELGRVHKIEHKLSR